MDSNIVSFEERARIRNENMRKKIKDGIDIQEVRRYYYNTVEVSIRHLPLLQRYLVEEYLAEIIYEFFFQGVAASKLYKAGRTAEEIERSYSQQHLLSIYTLANDFNLMSRLGEWDFYSVSIIAEDLAAKWFRHGLVYGKKQRKLRLL
ncbi:DUF2521 family protein [Aneurinibacillus thermoaerophilus]|uniref:DUF2521 family protein n=1 Tax=Aneurinibacillus thermoaerophilus TaxID=143495 RepID=A0ABX8YCI7_ANETH|nr:DUF2521 family protein [Aneurinibacillus thermoaerophilus]MED0738187.1 DUF2521 family protein [Aneurinibacillus thermoaerophilus]QYY43024.1 DUF2521 family protein [Aneurinibacillus thermoaerophilus]